MIRFLIRKFGPLVAIALVFTTTRADAAVFATFDAAQFDANGFRFGDFNDFFNTAESSGGMINIDISNDGDSVNGLFGGMGSDVVANFDAATTNLDVTLTVGPNNVANAFRVTLRDDDGGGTADEHVYEFDISTLTPGVEQTLSLPLSNGPLFTQPAFNFQPGDGIQNFGLTQMQVQSVFDSPDRLNIMIDSVKLEDPDDPLLLEFTSETYNAQVANFTFGTFTPANQPTALDVTGPTMIINADSAGTGGPNGGFGFSGLNVDFNATDYQIELEAKLLPGNTAQLVNLLLGDNDGDDSAPMMGSDDHIFSVDTSNFNTTEFSTVTIPLGTGSESDILTTFGFTNGGDGLQNFGLSQMQIQADGDTGGILNMEIARFSIVERTPVVGDFDNDGDVDGQDWLLLQQGISDGTLGASDLADWQNAYPTPLSATSAVPEPSTTMLLLCGAGLAAMRFRTDRS